MLQLLEDVSEGFEFTGFSLALFVILGSKNFLIWSKSSTFCFCFLPLVWLCSAVSAILDNLITHLHNLRVEPLLQLPCEIYSWQRVFQSQQTIYFLVYFLVKFSYNSGEKKSVTSATKKMKWQKEVCIYWNISLNDILRFSMPYC